MGPQPGGDATWKREGVCGHRGRLRGLGGGSWDIPRSEGEEVGLAWGLLRFGDLQVSQGLGRGLGGFIFNFLILIFRAAPKA